MHFPVVGELFEGRYHLERVLGEGGFATVFAANDQAASRPVALKVLKPEKGGYPEDVISRFSREVKIVANLSDPHTVTMFDFGTSADGFLYLVFEYVPGVDLSELIRQRGSISERDTIHIVTQVLRSLREAHRAGMLHRDIKPENIRVYEYGGDPLRVKLLDFGIARRSQGEPSRITRPGELVGTPRYMSPEQLLERELTPASDLYGLGLVTLEMLLGRQLLHGNSWSDQLERLKEGHSFDTASAQISPTLRNVVSRMSARDPAQRYQSAELVLIDLGVGVSSDSLRGSQLIPFFEQSTATPSADAAAYTPEAEPDVSSLELATTRTRAPAQASRARAKLLLFSLATLGILVVGLAAVVAVKLRPASSADPNPDLPPPAEVHRELSFLKQTDTPKPPSAPDTGISAPISPEVAAEGEEGTPGCEERSAPGTGNVELREMLGLEEVKWPVYVPKSYVPGRRHPVIFLFRDAGQPPTRLINEVGFRNVAEREGAILIAPPGNERFDGTGLYMRIWEEDEVVSYIHEAWNVAAAQLCLDPTRVFALGHGAGGYAVEKMACGFPVAAIASNAHVKVPTDAVCKPKHPVPYLVLLGTTDGYAPKSGGTNCAATPVQKVSWATKQSRWKDANGCTGQKKAWGKQVGGECYTWNCEADFVFCELDGGREWPGVRAPMWDKFNSDCGGYPSNFPSLSTIWEFFSKAPPRTEP